jgi:hydrogenase maturation protease
LRGDGPRVTPPDGGDRGTGAAARVPVRRPLIVGYGNPLRGDDGLGPLAAALLADDPRLRGAQVIGRHQLTPELAADFRDASLVILIDANVVDKAGADSVRHIDQVAASGAASSHHVEPAELMALAHELWGASPAVFVVSAGAASLEVGDGLSPAVEAALPAVVDAVAAIVAEHEDPGSPG